MARAAVLGRLSWLVGQLAEFRQETATARTLVFDVAGWAGHLPGQHVDVRLTAEDGYSTERSYSIASAPDGRRVELTVERLEDGEVSPYLTEVMGRGDLLELRGPIGGYFAWHPENVSPVLLIGGGSGVAPLMAMARTRIASGSTAVMRLVYSTRNPATLLYAAEMQSLVARNDGLTAEVVYTRAGPPGWNGPVGRLGAGRLRELAEPLGPDVQCFVCGPTGFVEGTANLLVGLGLAPGQVRTERFGPSGGAS
jgi:ferredoxin-NADP reductase